MLSITEILTAANQNPESILEHKNNNYLRNFMVAAYFPEKKMNLPEGIPPYKSNMAHEQQLRGSFWQIAKKIDIFQRTDLKPLRRESLFIQALESLPKEEADIFLAAKDQTIPKMFKKLTKKKLEDIGYFPKV